MVKASFRMEAFDMEEADMVWVGRDTKEFGVKQSNIKDLLRWDYAGVGWYVEV